MVFWDNTNYATYELAAQGEDGLAAVAVLYEVYHLTISSPLEIKSSIDVLVLALLVRIKLWEHAYQIKNE